MENQPQTTVRRHRRIILFPMPFQGHINPMIQLANLLYSNGFSIVILHTNFNAPKFSNYPNFTFISVLDNAENEPFSTSSSFEFAQNYTFKQDGADELRHKLELLLASGNDEPVSCLITDAIWHFTQSVADSLQIPRIVLRTTSVYCSIVYASIPLFDDRGYFALDDSLYIRASSKGQPFTIREVRASNIGQLVKISGIVTRCSDVKPLMKVAVYTCEECGFEIYQEVTARVFMPLFECPSKRCAIICAVERDTLDQVKEEDVMNRF